MESAGIKNFNEQLRERTITLAVDVYQLFKLKKSLIINRSMVDQVLRSSTSVAANCRAATRARSDGEFFSKICIVVEECDEPQFWFDFFIRTGIIYKSETNKIVEKIEQLVKIFTSIKKKMKDKMEKSKIAKCKI
jgi:four helix bundle protein